ncbi:hypothetical protein CF078_17260 [Clostridium botulinum]|uniref:Uncharacterized protein n=2 Tax=Clostridiaceae TaxID=31979 RepID=A0AAE6I951_CLOSG|nr:hypothetical protein [Clostridium botulinum]QDY34596.1 hypothetical protein CGS26_20065 [Clostridium sporogenes]
MMLNINKKLMNLPADKKEKVKKIINNNSYTKQIFNLINIMLEKELTQEQMKKFAKLNLLILKRQSKLCIEEYKMYFSIKKQFPVKFNEDNIGYENNIRSSIDLNMYIGDTVKTICIVGTALSSQIDEIQEKNIISEHELCQILSLNYILWIKNKKKVERKMENPKWSDIMYIYDCETVYNRKTAIDKGFWNTSPVYTALTESKFKNDLCCSKKQ